MSVNTPPGPTLSSAALMENLQADYTHFLNHLINRYGDIVYFCINHQPVYLLSDPTLIKRVLREWRTFCKTDSGKASNRGYGGDGLTTLEGDAWRWRRRLLQPAFRQTHLHTFVPTIITCVREMIGAWQPNQTLNLPHTMRTLVARIAARVILDADIEGFGDERDHPHRTGLIPLKEMMGVQFPTILIRHHNAFIQSVRPRAGRKMPVTRQIIKARFNSREQRNDMLSYLVQARDKQGVGLSYAQLEAEVLQMLFAGHLTTGHTLQQVWYALDQHPQVAATLRQELNQVLAGAVPTAQHLLNLPYTQAFIQETLRFYLFSNFTLERKVTEKVVLGGYTLPPGAEVWFLAQPLHFNPHYFPQPHHFNPMRFYPGHMAPPSPLTYLPFGVGPRACIGDKFALMEIALVLAGVAPHYHLALPPHAEDTAPLEMIVCNVG